MATDGAARRNVRVVEDALRVVFSEHRVDQVDTYFAEDFVQYSPYAPPGGRDVLKAWWAGFVYAVPDVTTTVIRPPVAQGQDVAIFRIVTGTVVHDLTALGIPGHGQHLEFRAADIFQVRAGMIVAHWETVDTGPLVQLAAAG
jgi:predicted SnoaL-like aldol condensation-catalyzing enzyme